MRNWGKRVVRAGAVLLPLSLAACQTLFRPCGKNGCDPDGNPVVLEPGLGHTPTMHTLACDLDHLEKHIDWYGSVVAKVPDVWGQARLTTHREQFEQEMVKNLPLFEETLQGSLARTDQSYFLQAVALSAAAKGGTLQDASIPGIIALPPPAAGATNPPNTTDPIAPFFVGARQFTPGNFRAGVPPAEGQNRGSLGVALEPTLVLAQKKRYLDFLNQIRRENEGDDTADSPGYNLDLIRIPVSVLPGKRTDTGHGAEVTMTLTPILGEDLLPRTFRNLVMNDLSQQLGFPITQVLTDQDKEITTLLTPGFQRFVQILTQLNDYLSRDDQASAVRLAQAIEKDKTVIDPDTKDTLYKAFRRYAKDQPEIRDAFEELVKGAGPNAKKGLGGPELRRYLRHSFPTRYATPTIGFANGLDNRTAFPTSQLLEVYGSQAVFQIVYGAQKAFERVIARQKYAHLPDIQSYLKEEGGAAYEFLRKNPQLMAHFCTPELVQAVRSRRVEDVVKIRQAYRAAVAQLTGFEQYDPANPFELKEPYHLGLTASLGWCIIVDSALLTDRLIRDMKETATSRGKPLPACEHWLPYYLPDPPPEARAAFNEYVALRWPIHVFALDPATQDQNLADSLLTRRETQLALSMAFSSGKINARTLTRYARRLEAEYETIALNRTQVGFGHGENVFGWRFYPRFQTPDTEGNLTVLFRDQLIGGPNRNALLRDRRLEPGPRECVAIVMMPSFVPYATLDVTSDWFGLANPKHKVLDHTQALRLSRTVQTIKTRAPGITDACDYRPGEFERLVRRAEQLEARLPSQTLQFPVPVLNTLGGFEMFSNGTTDLAPELYGWYGAPGIAEKTGTTVFLVGDHFSPLRTRVVVGNTEIDQAKNQTMLSRQVMQVRITGGVIPVVDKDGNKFAQVHVATPYGVTRELLIPVVGAAPAEPAAPAEGYTLEGGLTVKYVSKGDQGGTFIPVFAGVAYRDEFAVAWKDNSGSVPKEINVRFDFSFRDKPLQVAIKLMGDGKRFPVTADAQEKIGCELLRQINAQFANLPNDPNPLTGPLESLKVTVTPVGDGHTVQAVPAAPPLKVTFKAAPPGTDPKVCPVAVPPIPMAPPLLPVAPVAPTKEPLPSEPRP